MEADAARAVDALDEDRESVVADGQPRSHLRLVGELDQERPAQVAERQLPAGDVAEPDRGRAERVPRAWPAVTEHAEADERPRQREGSALRCPELAGQLAEGQALGRPVRHDLDQPHRPRDAADRVPAGAGIAGAGITGTVVLLC